MTDLENKVKDMAKDLGDGLIGRVKKYLKDETDFEFLREMAMELAQLQFQAMTASTEEGRTLAKEDIKFVHARIDSFIASNALKVRSEFEDIFNQILHTAGEVIGVVAKAALGTILPS